MTLATSTWTVASAPIYGGCAPPVPGGGDDWLPPEGYYADISLNSPLDVAPPYFPNGDTAGPFMNWCGSLMSTIIAGVVRAIYGGSGHTANAFDPLWPGTVSFNFETLRFSLANVPGAMLKSPGAGGTNYDPLYYRSLDADTLDHQYSTHTYGGVVFQPPEMGGGPMGSYIRIFIGGGTARNCIDRFDLSQPNAPSVRVVDSVNIGGSIAGTYPMAVACYERRGFYVCGFNGNGPLTFIKFGELGETNWQQTPFPGVQYNVYSDHFMEYIPAPWDCLFTMGHDVSGGPIVLRVSKFIGDTPQPWQVVTQSGGQPSDARCGTSWFPSLNALVSYEGGTSNQVHRITPPFPANMLTGVWAWSQETMIGLTGQPPSNPGLNPNTGFTQPYPNNGTWGKFKEIPGKKCAGWCNTVKGPMQAWRLRGML